MTKEQIKKAILNDEGCLDGIVDIIYRSKQVLKESGERFLENEVVGVWGAGYFGLYCDMKGCTRAAEILKLTPEVLAATVGSRIPDAKWAAVDKDGQMFFYSDEPILPDSFETSHWVSMWEGQVCRIESNTPTIYCPVDDWTKAKWKLK